MGRLACDLCQCEDDINVPEITAIPRRLRFPGGAASLSGPIAHW